MYSNINNPVNYQLQGFGQNGVRTISTDQLYIQGEYYRVLVAEGDSYVTAVSVLGDDLTAEFVYAGTTIYGLFTEVSVSSGSLTAYIAGPTDIEDVWAYINAYGQTNAATIEAADCAKDAIAPLLDKYYAKASLVMVPSLYKTSIVYSERPLTTDGQLAFTRSNDTATRVGPDGYIEKVRTNLALYSEQFNDAYWTKNDITVTADTTANPVNGATTADTLTRTGAVNGFTNRQIAQTGIVTFSIFAKSGSTNLVRLNTYDGAVDRGATYNLITGAITGAYGSPLFTTAQSVGNGWYRISISVNSATYTRCQVHIDSLDSVIVFGAQLESGDIATNYIPTTTSAVSVGPVANLPRLNYPINSDGSVGCPSLLLEPQRTNLVTYSEQFDDAAWAKTRVSVTANDATSPDGYTNADKMVSTDPFESYIQSGGISSLASGVFSFFAKKGSLDYCHSLVWDITGSGRRQWFNLATGEVGTTTAFGSGYDKVAAGMDDYGNGWYRCWFAWNNGVSVSAVRMNLSDADGSTLSPINSFGYFYGAQVESAVSYPTSYIPTLAASVTRGADACSKTGISSLIGQTEGTIYFEGSSDTIGASTNLINFNFAPNSVVINRQSTGVIRALINTTASSIILNSSPVSGIFKAAIGYKNGDSVLYVNGTLAASSTNSFTFATALTDVNLGTGISYFAAVNQSKCNQALLFKTRLTNQELQDLTTL